jgi:hypothetical protein
VVAQAGRLIRSAEQHQEECPISFVFGGGAAALASAGYVKIGGTSKVALYVGRSEAAKVYVKKGSAISVVVHPDAVSRAQKALGDLGAIGDAYHNSNMTTFPKRKHTGVGNTAYGYTVLFETPGALRKFLVAFDQGAEKL